MLYSVTVPDYNTEKPHIQFNISLDIRTLSVTAYFTEDGDWICRVYDVTNDVLRSFTLRSNACYFNKDPEFTIRTGLISEININTIRGLVLEIEDHAA